MRQRLVVIICLILSMMACARVETTIEGPPTTTAERGTVVATQTPTGPTDLTSPTPPAEATGPSEGTVTTTRAAAPTRTPQQALEPVVGLELVADGLGAPVDLIPANDDTGRLFIVDQVGVIRILTSEGKLLDEPFLDVRDRMINVRQSYDERGLLGLAFHPDDAEHGTFYVYYSAPLRSGAPQQWDHTSHLSAFSVSEANPDRAAPDSERVLLEIDQPQSNHNGGKIAFGPDEHLYVALGDGGGANDVGRGHLEDWYGRNAGGNGQNVSDTLLGSILRIDVGMGESYTIPDDNPFVGRNGLDEIWAYGFRNPYRFSFDAGGERALFVADVGQNLWEEVNLVTAAGNYGWNVREGTHCFSAETPDRPPEDCPDTDPDGRALVDPIIEYSNGNTPGGLGLAVIGGYVYRGDSLPGLRGRYVFGDWSTSFSTPDGSLFVATRPEDEGSLWPFEELQITTSDDGRLGEFLLGLGQDFENELYLLTSGTAGPVANAGRIYRIVPAD